MYLVYICVVGVHVRCKMMNFYKQDKEELSKELLKSIRENNVIKVDTLLRAGADVNRKERNDGMAPLHVAASEGQVAIAKMLLDAGADKNAKDSDNQTPLQIAAFNGELEIVKMMLDAGADVNTHDDQGRSALHDASEEGRTAIVKLLLDAGGLVNERDNNDDTPLHHSVRNGRVETVKLLLDAGADVNAKDSDGDSILHVAANRDDVEIVKLLLDAGANRNEKDQDGNTPLGIAKLNGYDSVVKILGSCEVDNFDTYKVRTLVDPSEKEVHLYRFVSGTGDEALVIELGYDVEERQASVYSITCEEECTHFYRNSEQYVVGDLVGKDELEIEYVDLGDAKSSGYCTKAVSYVIKVLLIESAMVGQYPYKGSFFILSRVPCRAVNCYTHAFQNNGFEPNQSEMNEFKKELKKWKSEGSDRALEFQFNQFLSRAQRSKYNEKNSVASRVKRRRIQVLEDVVHKVCVLKF